VTVAGHQDETVLVVEQGIGVQLTSPRKDDMNKDREKICKIMSEMFDGVNDVGIYPTSTCYTKLEHYMEQIRAEAIGWCHADACVTLDNGEDPRCTMVPGMYERAMVDLS